uniref:C2 domain-containing protein n=1 Tax=Schistocephalus solidus TaxID=70667 RepID=A0A0X3Q6A9_SCHSO
MPILCIRVEEARLQGYDGATSTFVSLDVCNTKSSTKLAQGCNPVWNEEFIFELRHWDDSVLVELQVSGLLRRKTIGMLFLPFREIRRGFQNPSPSWFQLDTEVKRREKKITGTSRPTEHFLLLDAWFEVVPALDFHCTAIPTQVDQFDDLGEEILPYHDNTRSSQRRRLKSEFNREGLNRDLRDGPHERPPCRRSRRKASPIRHRRPFLTPADAATEGEAQALLSSEQMDSLGQCPSFSGRRRTGSLRGAEVPRNVSSGKSHLGVPIYNRGPQQQQGQHMPLPRPRPTVYPVSGNLSSYPPGMRASCFYRDSDCSDCCARQLYSERDIPRASSSRQQQAPLRWQKGRFSSRSPPRLSRVNGSQRVLTDDAYGIFSDPNVFYYEDEEDEMDDDLGDLVYPDWSYPVPDVNITDFDWYMGPAARHFEWHPADSSSRMHGRTAGFASSTPGGLANNYELITTTDDDDTSRKTVRHVPHRTNNIQVPFADCNCWSDTGMQTIARAPNPQRWASWDPYGRQPDYPSNSLGGMYPHQPLTDEQSTDDWALDSSVTLLATESKRPDDSYGAQATRRYDIGRVSVERRHPYNVVDLDETSHNYEDVFHPMSDDRRLGSRHPKLSLRNSAFASSSNNLYEHSDRYRSDHPRYGSESMFPQHGLYKRHFRNEDYLLDPYVSHDFSPFGFDDRSFELFDRPGPWCSCESDYELDTKIISFDPKHRFSPIGASFHLEASSPSAEKPSLALSRSSSTCVRRKSEDAYDVNVLNGQLSSENLQASAEAAIADHLPPGAHPVDLRNVPPSPVLKPLVPSPAKTLASKLPVPSSSPQNPPSPSVRQPLPQIHLEVPVSPELTGKRFFGSAPTLAIQSASSRLPSAEDHSELSFTGASETEPQSALQKNFGPVAAEYSVDQQTDECKALGDRLPSPQRVLAVEAPSTCESSALVTPNTTNANRTDVTEQAMQDKKEVKQDAQAKMGSVASTLTAQLKSTTASLTSGLQSIFRIPAQTQQATDIASNRTGQLRRTYSTMSTPDRPEYPFDMASNVQRKENGLPYASTLDIRATRLPELPQQNTSFQQKPPVRTLKEATEDSLLAPIHQPASPLPTKTQLQESNSATAQTDLGQSIQGQPGGDARVNADRLIAGDLTQYSRHIFTSSNNEEGLNESDIFEFEFKRHSFGTHLFDSASLDNLLENMEKTPRLSREEHLRQLRIRAGLLPPAGGKTEESNITNVITGPFQPPFERGVSANIPQFTNSSANHFTGSLPSLTMLPKPTFRPFTATTKDGIGGGGGSGGGGGTGGAGGIFGSFVAAAAAKAQTAAVGVMHTATALADAAKQAATSAVEQIAETQILVSNPLQSELLNTQKAAVSSAEATRSDYRTYTNEEAHLTELTPPVSDETTRRTLTTEELICTGILDYSQNDQVGDSGSVMTAGQKLKRQHSEIDSRWTSTGTTREEDISRDSEYINENERRAARRVWGNSSSMEASEDGEQDAEEDEGDEHDDRDEEGAFRNWSVPIRRRRHDEQSGIEEDPQWSTQSDKEAQAVFRSSDGMLRHTATSNRHPDMSGHESRRYYEEEEDEEELDTEGEYRWSEQDAGSAFKHKDQMRSHINGQYQQAAIRYRWRNNDGMYSGKDREEYVEEDDGEEEEDEDEEEPDESEDEDDDEYYGPSESKMAESETQSRDWNGTGDSQSLCNGYYWRTRKRADSKSSAKDGISHHAVMLVPPPDVEGDRPTDITADNEPHLHAAEAKPMPRTGSVLQTRLDSLKSTRADSLDLRPSIARKRWFDAFEHVCRQLNEKPRRQPLLLLQHRQHA